MDFDGADIRKHKDLIEPESQLFFVAGPETLSQAVQVVPANLAQSEIDGRDIAAVIDVELNCGQDEGEGAAEEQNANQ